MASPPPAVPPIAVADPAPLRRLHFRLWQIAMTALTIILCGWFFWLGIIPGIIALFFAKHVLVAILVAVGMFRASGALDVMAAGLARVTSIPAEGLMMALVRPLSGSGALGVMTETMRANGPDSFVGYLVSVMNGSTETTFYVLALYFGSVGIRAGRHTVVACLAADLAGFVAAFAS